MRVTAKVTASTIVCVIAVLCLCGSTRSLAQRSNSIEARRDLDSLTLNTDAVAPLRFVAAHGQRAVMMGYPQHGLEMWAYPVQVLSGYGIEIRSEGAARATPGELLLRRIETRPQETTRIYIGPNYRVRERIFVPLDRPGAIVTYTVEGKPVEIIVHFTPVLDLMWPAGTGGQGVQWRDTLGGYILTEPFHRFGAAIVSPDTVAHDSTENMAVRPLSGMGFTLHPAALAPGEYRAMVFIGLDQETPETRGSVTEATIGAEVKQLAAKKGVFEAEAVEHYLDLRAKALCIETPDPQVNLALAWAEVALDQAWVCDPGIGCGLVAGYGPSRDARRPQYDWFFAGDGLIGGDGLLAAGEDDRVREELAFILKYQDAKTGMIWHELSQSASYLDWVGKYPYMYVHVDITYQFLSAVGRYVETTGDVDFVRQYWPALEAAYRYCSAQVDASTGLPQIPEGKEGGNEQDRMRDDLDLSSSWLAVTSSFAEIARLGGHQPQAAEARRAAEIARSAIGSRYWDTTRNFWIAGHTDAGKPILEERSGFGGLIGQQVFTSTQDAILLDKLAAADFQADWGTRNVSAASATYDPDAYARGSIFAVGTTAMASTFWQAHRPVTAESIWSTLPPLAWLDAPGHIHEVLAGNFYHQQAESVPEQTWSSGGFLYGTVRGLLGLEIQAEANRVIFAPHLPADWKTLSLEHVRSGHGTLNLKMKRMNEAARGIVALDVSNDGPATGVTFDPEIPLGALVISGSCNGHAVPAKLETHPQDQHARIDFTAGHGATHCEVRFQGGVEIAPDPPHALVGDASHGLKIVGTTFEDGILTVSGDAMAGRSAGFDLLTAEGAEAMQGGRLVQTSNDRYRVTLDDLQSESGPGYVRRVVKIQIGRASPRRGRSHLTR